MPKMVLTMNLEEEHIDRIKEVAPEWDIIVGRDKSFWLEHLDEAEIIGSWNKQAEEKCLQEGTKLKWVQTWGAGVDGIPFAAFKERGIQLTNASGVHAFNISETIIGLMLALTRKIHSYVRNQMEQKWHHAHLSLEMHGKTVGILGVGEIGLETAKICKAFQMKVLGLRYSGKDAPFVDHMYKPEEINKVLMESDYIVNTLPLTKDTYHLLGENEFMQMKNSAFLINIGRGKTIQTEALLHALKSGEIAGAGLDVFEIEPLPEDHPLWKEEKVIITPHSAGSTEHYNERVIDIFIDNLQSYVQGKALHRNLVDLDKQY